MPSPKQKEQYGKRFSRIEASFRIEGMDPSGDKVYETAKAKILDGAMTPKQALEFVIERSAKRRTKVAV